MSVTTIGIIGAGAVGSQLARATLQAGYGVVIANSRGPGTLQELVGELGRGARADTVTGAAASGDVVVLAYPYVGNDSLPVAELVGKIVIDTNNYMAWRDGELAEIKSGAKTIHELRQEQLPLAKIVKAFTQIQAPSLFHFARPAGAPGRHAPAVSSNYPEAVECGTDLYDQIGFDAVDNSPLSESWRSAPGSAMWNFHHIGQDRRNLTANLAKP